MEENRCLKCGTLTQLVASLFLNSGELDSINVNTFFATYRTFATTSEVLDELTTRYLEIDDDQTVEEQNRDRHKRSVENVLLVWMEKYPEDFQIPQLNSLLELSRQHIHDSLLDKKINDMMHNEVDKSYNPTDQSTRLASEIKSAPKIPISRPKLSLFTISRTALAEQMTYMDAELFKRVVPYQCLGSVWSHRGHNPSDLEHLKSVVDTIDQFNAVTFRVTSTILEQPNMTSAERVAIVERWIDIAQECRKLKNFSSLKAVISALQSSSIYRLQSVWKELKREKLQLYQELSAIFREDDNQKSCRDLLIKVGTAKSTGCTTPDNSTAPKKRGFNWMGGWAISSKSYTMDNNDNKQWSSEPSGAVPYLGIFLTDLMMLDTAFKDRTESGLINFEKKKKEFEILTHIKLLQSAAGLYRIKPDQQIIDWFNQMTIYDDNTCYKMSLDIEPFETSDSNSIVSRHKKQSSFEDMFYRSIRHQPSFSSSSTCSSDDFQVEITSSESSPRCPLTSEDSEQHSDTTSWLSVPKMSRAPSLNSLLSLEDADSASSSSPKERQAIVIKVFLKDSNCHSTNHYKCLMLNNRDRTNSVILKVFDKFNIVADVSPDEYVISQLLPDGTEIAFPENCNVFYAINMAIPEIECTVRRKVQR